MNKFFLARKTANQYIYPLFIGVILVICSTIFLAPFLPELKSEINIRAFFIVLFLGLAWVLLFLATLAWIHFRGCLYSGITGVDSSVATKRDANYLLLVALTAGFPRLALLGSAQTWEYGKIARFHHSDANRRAQTRIIRKQAVFATACL